MANPADNTPVIRKGIPIPPATVRRVRGGRIVTQANGDRVTELDPIEIQGNPNATDEELDLTPSSVSSEIPEFTQFDRDYPVGVRGDEIDRTPADISDAQHRYGPQQFLRDAATQLLPDAATQRVLPYVNRMDASLARMQRDESIPRWIREGTRGYDPDALAMGIAQGLTFNRFDELAGGIAGMRRGGTEQENEAANQAERARLRALDAETSQRSPVSHAFGSLAGGTPYAMMMPGGQAGTLARRMATGGAAGAALGELYGSGNAARDLREAPAEVAASGLPQAAVGGAIGAAAPLVQQGLRGLGRMAAGTGQRLVDRAAGRAPIAAAEEVASTAPGEFANVPDSELIEASPADLARAGRRRLVNPSVAFGSNEPDAAQAIARRLSQQQRDLEPFLDEGIGLKRDAIEQLMDEDERALFRNNPAALEDRIVSQWGEPRYEVVDANMQRTAPGRLRGRAAPAALPADTEAARMPMMRDRAGRMVSPNAEPLPAAPLRETNGRILPALTESNEAPSALATEPPTAIAPESPTINLDVAQRPPAREFQGDRTAWQQPYVRAHDQVEQTGGILDNLRRFAEDPRNMRGGIVRSRLQQLEALQSDAQRAMQNGIGDRAGAFIALDRMKRVIGQIRRAAERGAIPDEALAAQAEQAYSVLQRGLEDAETWGEGATALQRETNAAWSRYLGTSREADRFLSDVGQRGSNPWNDVPVANAEQIQGMIENAPRWQQQEQRNLFRRHVEASGALAEDLQRYYGGSPDIARRAGEAGREMSARLGLEEQRAAGPIMDLARRVGDNRVGRALEWLGDAFGATPDNPATRELRSIVEASASSDAPRAVSERTAHLLEGFSNFAQRQARTNPGAIGDLWDAYQRQNPQVAQDLSQIRTLLHRDTETLGGAVQGESQLDSARQVDSTSLRDLSNRIRRRAEGFER